MAQKRMVSDNICDTVTFTEMSASARALYLHLHCASDEDGCCNGAKVLKSAKLRNSALDELIKNGYAIPLVNTPPKERIVYLADWHNLNRYRHALNNAPVYRKQLVETIPDIQNALFEAKNDTVFAPSIGKLSKGKSSQGKSSIGELSQVEESIGNVSIDNGSADKPSTDKTNTYSQDNTIPTMDLVVNELMSTYYLTTTESQDVGTSFITYNSGKNWSGLKHKSWTMLLKQFVEHDKRYTQDKIELRKAEAKKKAEEERIEQEQKDEAERKQQEYKSMFRECWGDYLSINSAQDLLDYIKTNHFSEYDYSLGKCLYDQLYVSHTLEEITVMALFDKGIIAYDEVSDYIRINDCDIEQAKEPIKKIAEKLKKDSWSEKYRVPEPPKVFVPYQRSVPWQ